MSLLNVTAVVWLVNELYSIKKAVMIVFATIVDHRLFEVSVVLGICALIYYVFVLINCSLIYNNKIFFPDFSLIYIVNYFASLTYFVLCFVFEQARFIY